MAWHNNKVITGLFSYGPQNRNSWIYIKDLGWKQLWNAYDCQSEAMTAMASHARSEGRLVHVYEESGQIKTMYVW